MTLIRVLIGTALLTNALSFAVYANDGSPAEMAVLHSINAEATHGNADMANEMTMAADGMANGMMSAPLDPCAMASTMFAAADIGPMMISEIQSSDDPAAALAEAMGGDAEAAELLMASLESTGGDADACDGMPSEGMADDMLEHGMMPPTAAMGDEG